jgi:hypothetical protein
MPNGPPAYLQLSHCHSTRGKAAREDVTPAAFFTCRTRSPLRDNSLVFVDPAARSDPGAGQLRPAPQWTAGTRIKPWSVLGPAARYGRPACVIGAVYSYAMAASTLVRADRIAGRMAATTPITAASTT